MNVPPVLLVGETPSLGRSLGDLLLTEGIACRLVSEITNRELDAWRSGPPSVILVACNESYCRTARRWLGGEFPGTSLVVVGARDPDLRAIRGVRVVPLPLQREPFLELLRELTSASGTG